MAIPAWLKSVLAWIAKHVLRVKKAPEPSFDVILRLRDDNDPEWLLAHYRSCFDTKSGRIVLAHILLSNGIFSLPDPMLPPPDHTDLALERGRREAALQIYQRSGGMPATLAAQTISPQEQNYEDENEYD